MENHKDSAVKKAKLYLKEIVKPGQKESRERPLKPRGYLARKAGVITFWLLFIFMFTVVLSTLLNKTSATDASISKEIQVKENRAASEEGIQFANNFARNYMSWQATDEGKKIREKIMGKYMAKGLDKYAGLNMDQLNFHSAAKRIELRRIEKSGDNRAYITMYVESDMTKKEPANPNERPVAVKKYLTVPVEYDGKTFGVFELPKFTFIDEQTTVKAEGPNNLNEGIKDSEKVREFLETFFKSYSEDPKEKLGYMLKDNEVTAGLNQTMTYVKLKSADFYEGKKPNQIVAIAEILLEEPQTKAVFTAEHQVTIEKEGGRYIVTSMDKLKNGEEES